MFNTYDLPLPARLAGVSGAGAKSMQWIWGLW